MIDCGKLISSIFYMILFSLLSYLLIIFADTQNKHILFVGYFFAMCAFFTFLHILTLLCCNENNNRYIDRPVSRVRPVSQYVVLNNQEDLPPKYSEIQGARPSLTPPDYVE